MIIVKCDRCFLIIAVVAQKSLLAATMAIAVEKRQKRNMLEAIVKLSPNRQNDTRRRVRS